MPEAYKSHPKIFDASFVLGMASFICALLSFLRITVVLAIIFGIVGLIKSKKDPFTIGRGLSIAGIFISSAFIILFIVVDIRQERYHSGASCIANIKQIGLACFAYSHDNNGFFPSEGLDILYPKYFANKKFFVCPQAVHSMKAIDLESPQAQAIGYDYIKGLEADDDPNLVLAYDNIPRHGDKIKRKRNVVFVDGHAKVMNEAEFQHEFEKTKKYLMEKDRN